MNREKYLINLLKIANTNHDHSKLSNDILEIEGMSGIYFKHFLNNLLSDLYIKNYLEIGVWKGSTSIAGLYSNDHKLNYYLIDNFCSFGGPKQEFENNFQKFLNKPSKIIDSDCFNIDPKNYNIDNIDVYFFDGPHEEADQYNALKHYYDSLNKSFIFIVDDWNWEMVRKGTLNAIKELNLKIHEQIEHFTETPNKNTWWNGYSFFVLEK